MVIVANLLHIVSQKGSSEILALLAGNSLSYSQLAMKIKISGRVLTKRLKELSNSGLIKRDLRDNRRVFYHITDRGKKVLVKITEIDNI